MTVKINRKVIAGIAVAVSTAVSTAACGSYGESHDHNAAPPAYDIRPTWVRIDSPGNYHTIIFACHGKDGIYLTIADNNSATVVANDPECAGGHVMP